MSAAKKKVPTQVVGNVGLYYVCYRLSLRGWNVMPTARNARGIDLLIYSEDGQRKLSVQAKALSDRSPVPLGTDLEHLIADFLVVVRRARVTPPDQPECFVLTPGEVQRLVHVSRDGKHSHWLQPRAYEADEFRNGWHRIGDGFDAERG